jgi:hypothetical protein
MTCNACLAEVPDSSLHLTEEGQYLCRQCYGQYLSVRATRQQRTAEVYRRCSCGSALSPHESPDDQLDLDELSRHPFREGVTTTRWHLDVRDQPGIDDLDDLDGDSRRITGLTVLDRYSCSKCGNTFAMQRPLAVVVSCLFLAVIIAGGLTRGDRSGLVLAVILLMPLAGAVLGWDFYHRLRYPRIR